MIDCCDTQSSLREVLLFAAGAARMCGRTSSLAKMGTGEAAELGKTIASSCGFLRNGSGFSPMRPRTNELFEIGDRVRLSKLGEFRIRKMRSKIGTVVGFGYSEARIRVLFDGLSQPVTLHRTYLINEQEEHGERGGYLRPVTKLQPGGQTGLTAFFFLIVAPILLLIAIWIMKADERRRNRLNLRDRHDDTFE